MKWSDEIVGVQAKSLALIRPVRASVDDGDHCLESTGFFRCSEES